MTKLLNTIEEDLVNEVTKVCDEVFSKYFIIEAKINSNEKKNNNNKYPYLNLITSNYSKHFHNFLQSWTNEKLIKILDKCKIANNKYSK